LWSGEFWGILGFAVLGNSGEPICGNRGSGEPISGNCGSGEFWGVLGNYLWSGELARYYRELPHKAFHDIVFAVTVTANPLPQIGSGEFWGKFWALPLLPLLPRITANYRELPLIPRLLPFRLFRQTHKRNTGNLCCDSQPLVCLLSLGKQSRAQASSTSGGNDDKAKSTSSAISSNSLAIASGSGAARALRARRGDLCGEGCERGRGWEIGIMSCAPAEVSSSCSFAGSALKDKHTCRRWPPCAGAPSAAEDFPRDRRGTAAAGCPKSVIWPRSVGAACLRLGIAPGSEGKRQARELDLCGKKRQTSYHGAFCGDCAPLR